MPTTESTRTPIALGPQASAVARRIASAHRRLIADASVRTKRADLPRTLIACSGGPDSCALAVSLAMRRFPVAMAHIVHDMRPQPEALADRDIARELAARLGVEFYEATVSVRTGGNIEAAARRERYRALGALAREHGCAFVATAHHADDQLETLVMSLIRGTGPHGLRGIAPRKRLGDGVTIVRPMLEVRHEEALVVCAQAGITPAEDATNLDISRFRAALRAGPIREIVRLRPAAPVRAGRTARLMRDLSRLVDEAVAALPTKGPAAWDRQTLRETPGVVVGAVLRSAFGEVTGGHGADALRGRMIDGAVRAIASVSTDPKAIDWPQGVRVSITAREVRVHRR